MRKLFLIFNHVLTEEQEKEAKEVLKITQIISLPQHLQDLWSNIPPDKELSSDLFSPITSYLLVNRGEEENYCLIQGDFGATVYLVSWCFKHGFIPIYATTKRVAQEIV
ncbi:CRISPR-associated protein Csx20, partial [Caldicellulosiruptor bescii]